MCTIFSLLFLFLKEPTRRGRSSTELVPKPIPEPFTNTKRHNRKEVPQSSSVMPTILPQKEQVDTVDHALQLDQEESVKEPVFQSELVDEAHQKRSAPRRLLQTPFSSHTSMFTFLFTSRLK